MITVESRTQAYALRHPYLQRVDLGEYDDMHGKDIVTHSWRDSLTPRDLEYLIFARSKSKSRFAKNIYVRTTHDKSTKYSYGMMLPPSPPPYVYFAIGKSIFLDPNKKTAAEQVQAIFYKNIIYRYDKQTEQYALVTDVQQTPESKADYYAQAKTDSTRSPDAFSADGMAKYIASLTADRECHIDYFYSDGSYYSQVEGEAFFNAPYILIRETRFMPTAE